MKKLDLYAQLSRPFTLLPPLLGIISGAICAWGSVHNPDPSRTLTLSVDPHRRARLALRELPERRLERDQPDLRPRDRPRQQAEAAAGHRRAHAARGVGLHLDLLRAGARADLAGGGLPAHDAGRRRSPAPLARHETFFIYLAGLVFTFVYSVPALGPHQGARHARQLDDRDPARLPAQGRRLGDGRPHRPLGALVDRLDLHALPGRRRVDQGLRRHRRGPRRRLQDAADPARAAARRPGSSRRSSSSPGC